MIAFDLEDFLDGMTLKESSTESKKESKEEKEEYAENMTSSADKSMDKFIGELFYYRNLIHLLHLKTDSYAKHIALNELYDALLPQIDILAESAQTEKQLNITIPETKIEGKNELETLQCFLDCVRSYRCCCMYSFQQSEVDIIERDISAAIYKIKFLK